MQYNQFIKKSSDLFYYFIHLSIHVCLFVCLLIYSILAMQYSQFIETSSNFILYFILMWTKMPCWGQRSEENGQTG